MMLDPDTTRLSSQYLIELGFAVALAACLWKRHWGYAAFLALALVESHEDLRYPFHVWVRDALLGQSSIDAEKHSLQYAFIYTASGLGFVILLLLAPKLIRASVGHRLMIGGTAIVVAMLATELISLHNVDALIYHPAGPFARAAVAYFIGSAAIACGALLTPQRHQSVDEASAPRGIGSDA